MCSLKNSDIVVAAKGNTVKAAELVKEVGEIKKPRASTVGPGKSHRLKIDRVGKKHIAVIGGNL